MKSKKGGGRIVSIYMFIVWIIIALAIVIGVIIFYSKEINVNKLEAKILAIRVADCLVEDGYLIDSYNADFDIYFNCKLSKKIIDDTGLYYVGIYISDENGKEKFKPVIEGSKDFETLCDVKKISEAKNWPECHGEKIYALDKQRNIIDIIIIAGSNNIGKKL